MLKILHTADLHLREYGDERWKSLQSLIEIGKKEKINIFIISGDLFDKGVNAENLRAKIRGIFSNSGFKILLISGNHDKDCYRGGRFFGEDINILTDVNNPFEYANLRIWGMPFEPIEEEEILRKLHSLTNKLTSVKQNIILYHGELLDTFFSRGDFGDEGRGRYMPIKLSYFKDLNVNYVLAGHFHSHFDVRQLPNGGYFVYPGSPISITRREIGKRKVNIFEVGKTPKEYSLDTPHFKAIVIELDPYKDKKLLEIVKASFRNLHPKAKIILTVKGFINSETIGMDEEELKNQIQKHISKKCEDMIYEVRDVHTILEDDLFKRFIEKLEQTDYTEEKKKEMRDITINATIKASL